MRIATAAPFLKDVKNPGSGARLWIAPGRGFAKTKNQNLHRAEAQRRRERQNQNFVALTCEKPVHALSNGDLLVLSGEAGEICGFLSVFAREYCFYSIASYL